jgi:cobyrinic acid a,c-diamide synthase
MALIIGGDRSGVGKTTITLAILAYLSRQQKKIQSFKVGPDYIDPMFHTAITGNPCRNLDPILTSENYVKSCFSLHSQTVKYVVVEGVMGLFDGISFPQLKISTNYQLNDYGSTAHIARLLNLPVLLVLDCARLSTSIAAIAHGYRSFDPRVKIAGVVLNKVGSDRHLELLKDALQSINLPIFGVLRRHKEITIPDRHLGLVPSEEINQLDTIFAHLADLAQTCFDWQKLLPLLKSDKRQVIEISAPVSPNLFPSIRIAIARDRAFNFYYQDNLDLLSKLGAELVFWSPLEDESLPKNIQGIYFGGGFPEVFASQLAANQTILQQLRAKIETGMPTYAECGGLMYLCQQIIYEAEADSSLAKKSWQMVGVIPATAIMTKTLTLGYRQATVLENSPIVSKQESIWGHEFHHSRLNASPLKPLWHIQGYKSSIYQALEGWKLYNLHASYLHLHFGEYPHAISKFLQHCFLKIDKL